MACQDAFGGWGQGFDYQPVEVGGAGVAQAVDVADAGQGQGAWGDRVGLPLSRNSPEPVRIR